MIKTRNSIIFKLSLLMFTITILISGIIGIFAIKDANKIIQKEMYSMRTRELDEISNNISTLLSNVETIGNNIVVDDKLIDILSIDKYTLEEDSQLKKDAGLYVEGLLTDEVWKYGKFNMKPELYVIGHNGLTYSTYSKTKYDIESIKRQEWYEKIIRGNGDTILINTYKDENGIGPYKNILKMGRLIKDLITKETLGILIIDISEIMLYDTYVDGSKDGTSIYIIDSKGTVISSKDKRYIGTYYEDISNKDIDSNKITRQDMKIISKIDEYQWSIIKEVPLKVVRQPINEIAKKILAILVILSIISIIITYKSSVWITKPILNIIQKMDEVIKGNLKTQVKVDRNDEIGQLENSFNSMVNRLDISINEIKEKENQKRLAELSFLQAQINPHFLYNTLSGVRSLISMNKLEEAEEMLYRFTKLLRSLLPKASEMITLEEEITNIKNYVELQKLRYPMCFDVIYNINSEIYSFKVPSFILQPIVENAVLYTMEKENNKGLIIIEGYSSEDGIRIIISDNGIGMSKDQVRTILSKESTINSVGVINVQERIQLNYGKEYSLEVDSVQGQGTKITFILPGQGE